MEWGKDPSVGAVVGQALLGILPCLAVLAEDMETLGFAGSGWEKGLVPRIGVTFVGEIVGYAGKGVDCVDMVTKVFWDKTTHGKVFVVGLSQLSTGLIRVP